MAVPAPPHLLRLEPLDLLSRCHGSMRIRARVILNWRLRQQRSGLGSRGKSGSHWLRIQERVSDTSGVPLRSLLGRIPRDAEKFRRRDLNSC
jgi:hypothetical protein